MTTGKLNVCIISQTPEISGAVVDALRGNEQISTNVVGKRIDAVNGSISTVLARNNVIVVDLQSAGEDALPAITAMLAGRREGAGILALSDGEISLSEARRYRLLGIDDVLPVPFAPEDLRNAISRFQKSPHVTAGQAAPAPHGAVIGVTHASGGAGATTLAVNLAFKLLGRHGVLKKKSRKRVAIVDLDLQFGTVGQHLDLASDGAMMSLLSSGEVPDAEFVESLIKTHGSGLSVVTAPETPVPLDAMQPEQAHALVDQLSRMHDYVVLDMPLQLVRWTEPLLKRLDRVLLVTSLTVPGILNARRLIDLYAEERSDLPIDIVLNREAKPMLGSQMLRNAERALDRKIAFWIPEDSRTAREAINRGSPAIEAHSGSAMSKAIRKVAAAVAAGAPRN